MLYYLFIFGGNKSDIFKIIVSGLILRGYPFLENYMIEGLMGSNVGNSAINLYNIRWNHIKNDNK